MPTQRDYAQMALNAYSASTSVRSVKNTIPNY